MKLPLHLPSPPRPLVFTLLLLGVASVVPLTIFLMHSTSFHAEPRIHLFQDMDNQVKFKAQAASALFADGRAMRPAVPGAVGRGGLANDDHLVRGFELVQGDATEENPSGIETSYFSGFPAGVEVDPFFLKHGQERYEAMCSLCHGLDGRGNGPVHRRAQQLMTSGRGLGTSWVPPASLLKIEGGQLAYGSELYPEGEMYNTIANGKGNMTGYAHAIPVEDRWAIVAYIRALQDAQKGAILAEADAAASDEPEASAATDRVADPEAPTVDASEGPADVPELIPDLDTEKP